MDPAAPASARAAAARAARWTLLESAGLSGLSLLCLVVISRYLDAAAFGIAAVALSIVQILVAVVERLFHDPLVQRPQLGAAERDSAFTATLLLGAAFSIACGALGPWLADRLDAPQAGPVLQWMGLSVVAMGWGSVLIALHRRELAFRPLALRSLAARSVSALAAIGLAVAGAGVWSLVAQQVLIVGLASAGLWLFSALPRPRLGWDTGALRALLRIGLPSTALQLVYVATPRVFVVLVGSLLGATVAGHFSLAQRAVDMLRDVVGGAVSQLALPLFVQVERDGGDRRRALVAAVRLTTALMFPLFAGLAALAPELVETAFGAAWLPASPYVALMALLCGHFFVRMFIAPLLTAVGRPTLMLGSAALQLGFVLAAMAAFGSHSPAAAAAIWAGRLAVSLPLDMWLCKRATGIAHLDQWRGAGAPALAALAMAAALWLLARALQPALDAPLRLLLLAPLGALLYAAMLWLVDRRLLRELADFARSAAARRGAPRR
ncbi:MAG TPA: oligosaccharide flippase family protein [Methylibium sp.]|nr:oligosaccharide flippase family protein [Methylibium sp.]